ncbi:MAG: phosphate uptake regulator PhoU, partial [Anaerolineae bacterium]|nr:phosphate uptake regulator PhoU [Anaerolineae bacterium]
QPPIKPLIDIPRMYEIVVDMLQRSLDAFVNHDVEAARAIPAEDDLVDALYNQVNSELITLIMAHPDQIEQANYLTWAAHNLERAADRVTNICERIIYTETGIYREIDAAEFGVAGVN